MVNPPIDSTMAEELLGIAAKPIVEKGIAQMAEKAEKINIAASDTFKVLGRDVSIYCPEGTQEYSLSLEAKKTGLFNGHTRFDFGPVRRAVIKPLMGMQPINAISMTAEGFDLNLRKLTPGEVYILDVDYKMNDPRFIDTLVSKNHAHETSSEESSEYWMVAQLKHVDVLKSKFLRIDLEDVDFNVNVGVHEDVKTKIPNIFRDQLETLVKIAGPLGRGEVWNQYSRLLHVKSQKYGDKDIELLGQLAELFTPDIFGRYLSANQDFVYSNCEKGADVYDIPFGIWPKFMTATSRTDLGLDKPAAKGTLVYQKRDFLKRLEDVFK